MFKSQYFNIYLFLFAIINMFGCQKFVQINPPANKLISSNVFNSDASATSAITGIYGRMVSSNGFASGGPSSITLLCGLSADELINYSYSADQNQFYINSITIDNGNILNYLWSEPYQYIYTANSILEGLNSSSGLSDSVKQQIIGEAKFVRAFCYFYLTNLFGDVPLYLTSNYQTNAVSVRSASSVVNKQIVSDLSDAINLMSSNYSFSNGEKIRPNKWTASALLARTYLYLNQWDSAEIVATSIINSGAYNLVPDLNAVFLANSNEAIWQLLPIIPNINTQEGYTFILTADPTNVTLSDSVRKAFEPGDNRYVDWISSFTDGSNTWYFPYKYKVQASSTLTEYSMIFRLAEQYLIRAEARMQENNISGSQDDLNVIRLRAGLPNTTAGDPSSLALAIEHERQTELFTEWGHRWLDLKRTGRSNTVLGPIKAPTWQSYDTLYPIPQAEIQSNSNITQNKGY
jgi:starch-binding outer membrane protein, SusD/RagB family